MTTLLVVMGSGETTPTMVTTHQRVFAALGDDPRALVLDTPYGFQENADEVTAKTQEYFATSVGVRVQVASLRRADALSPVRAASLVADVREADWVYAGPGSPTYLARQWRETPLPDVLAGRLAQPGATVFASAAAVTLGAHAVPVYEIYKAGADPHWAPGLDLLAGIGLDAVCVPHYDNADGTSFDTRFCYLGDRRLTAMEAQLPATTWVLGVDEHTALVADLSSGAVRVEGRGRITVRARDRAVVFPSGSTVELGDLVAAATGAGSTTGELPPGDLPTGPAGSAAAVPADAATAGIPLLEDIARHAAAFDDALRTGSALDAAEVTVRLEQTIRDWATDVETADHLERARAELRRQVTALARVAQEGLHAHRELVAPHVELLLRLRESARAERRFADADAIREALVDGGVEVRDSPEGTAWTYHDPLDAARRDR
jgi:cyanophycinase-like exopeptidase